MNYKAVLFDFDYTLADATEAIVAGFRYAFGQMGLPLPEREAVRRTVGYMLEDEYTMLSGDDSPERRTEFLRLYREKAGPIQTELTVLLPGAEELLRTLYNAGVPTGIVSSKRAGALNEVLDRFDLRPLLHSVTGGDNVRCPKPHPEGLLAAVAALALPPEAVLYCGDTVLDAEAAQRAALPFCAVLNGTTGAEAFAAYPHAHIAPDLMELRAWLGLP